MKTQYCVDGAVSPNDPDGAEFQGDGKYPPFVVFDIDNQQNLPGEYATRADAELALSVWAVSTGIIGAT